MIIPVSVEIETDELIDELVHTNDDEVIEILRTLDTRKSDFEFSRKLILLAREIEAGCKDEDPEFSV